MKIALDKYQQEAVFTKEKNVLVVAAPGSGKTTVIINRVNYLVEEQKVRVGNIIVITFTRAAADNMRNRYKQQFSKDIAPFFGTFHGLFYKILLREGFEIKIMEQSKGHSIVKAILAKYFDDVNDDRVREVINYISLYKTSMKALEDFDCKIAKDIFIHCYNSYEEYKVKEKQWDFDDLSITTINLLKDNENILNKYKRMFKYILVDEFQDCDQLQIDFLKIINDNNEIFAVGDEDQCIYSFRGSKPEYMVDFNKCFIGGKKKYLSVNYRSKQNIVEISRKIIANNRSRNNKNIIAYNKTLGIIRHYKPYNELMQGEEIVKIIKSQEGVELNNNAVLYRTNIEARSIIDVFTKYKISFLLLDKGYNFFNHFICRDIINYLFLSLNPYDKEAFISIINKPFRYISKASISYINSYKEQKSPFDILIEKEDVPPFQKKKLNELKNDILYLNKMSLGGAIQYIISTLGYIDYLKEYANKFGQSFNDLEDILEEFKGAALDFKTILEFLNHVKEVEEEIQKSKKQSNGVILSTIHGVKGMEFKNVFMINCDEEIIPHKSSMENNIEEERRLFYVGITRAINNLFVFSPKTIRGKFHEISSFVKEGSFEEENLKLDYDISVDDNLIHRTYGEGKVELIEKEKICIKFDDGVNRAFSLPVLIENNLIYKIK